MLASIPKSEDRLVVYEPSHYGLFLDSLSAVTREPYLAYAEQSKNLTGGFSWLHRGEVIMICGVTKVWQGVGEGYLLLGEEAKNHPFTLYRYADKTLQDARKKYHRVSAAISVDLPKAARFVESLGMEREFENPMKKYGPDGSDFYLYVLKGTL